MNAVKYHWIIQESSQWTFLYIIKYAYHPCHGTTVQLPLKQCLSMNSSHASLVSLVSTLVGHSVGWGKCIFNACELVFNNFHLLDVLDSSEGERVCGKLYEERSYWTVPARSLFPLGNSISNLCEIILNMIFHLHQIIDQPSQFCGAKEITDERKSMFCLMRSFVRLVYLILYWIYSKVVKDNSLLIARMPWCANFHVWEMVGKNIQEMVGRISKKWWERQYEKSPGSFDNISGFQWEDGNGRMLRLYSAYLLYITLCALQIVTIVIFFLLCTSSEKTEMGECWGRSLLATAH